MAHIMSIKPFSISIFLAVIFPLIGFIETPSANPIIVSEQAVRIELTGFEALAEKTIFEGELSAGEKQEIDIPYRGLALLSFPKGQTYPLIITDNPLTIKIDEPGIPPVFESGSENDYFYKLLAGAEVEDGKFPFANLMIRAKNLLESSYNIKTLEELTAKKKEFHEFVRKDYQGLKHSDMVRRLMSQFFMMHEYVDYHQQGKPAADIRVNYQREVVSGVKGWLETLTPHLSKNEVLNHCVSFYYQRSMVALASHIMQNFPESAYCSGEEKSSIKLPGKTRITKGDDGQNMKLADMPADKIIAFVSEECPVSMVEAVIQARRLAARHPNAPLIVAPVEKLSEKHLSIARMVSRGNILFINDDKWRKENLPGKIKLPLSMQ